MTVPNSLSSKQLQKLLDSKHKQKQEQKRKIVDASPKQMHDIATKYLDAMIKDIPDPLVHKTAAMLIIDRMIRWHISMAQKEKGSDSISSAQDSGRLAAAYELLRNVSLGDNDTWV